MINKKISIIGAGHIGLALFRGLISGREIAAKNFILSNPHLEKLKSLEKELAVKLTSSNIEAAKKTDVIIIAVRPRMVIQVIDEIKSGIKGDKLIISVATCVTRKMLEDYFGLPKLKIVRIMPNIPMSYRKGVVGWVGNRNIAKNDEVFIDQLLSPLGVLVKCKDDENLERLSVIAGCGPGYVTYFMQNLQKVAETYGFTKKDAYKIILTTFLGTAYHLQSTNSSFEDMLTAIATKGGITGEVINSWEKGDFYQLLEKGINKGYYKIGKITSELRKKE